MKATKKRTVKSRDRISIKKLDEITGEIIEDLCNLPITDEAKKSIISFCRLLWSRIEN